MKNPHNTSEYKKVEGDEALGVAGTAGIENADIDVSDDTHAVGTKKKLKYSGAYYYVDADEQKLKEAAFIRTLLTITAFMLQITVLLLPQGGLEYVTNNITSYAYAYTWVVFVMFGVSIWLLAMNAARYKFEKRIPIERAPRRGFAHRAYFGAELYIAVNAIMFVLELSFVCIHYDPYGLIGMLLTAIATVSAALARVVTHKTLKNARLVEPAEIPEHSD